MTLRALTDKRILVVDANLAFGDLNIFLDLPFGRSIRDLLPRIDELDSDLLNQVLASHASGIQVLVRPEQSEVAETVLGADIEKVLRVLPRVFDYVVVDCEVSYSEKMLAVLDRADVILLVLTPDLGAVRNATYFLRMCDVLGYPRSKLTFVLNRAGSDVGFSVSDVEKALDTEHVFRLGTIWGLPVQLEQYQYTRR